MKDDILELNQIKVCLFDIDWTLLNCNSSLMFIKYMINYKLLRPDNVMSYYLYKSLLLWKFVKPEIVYNKYIKLLANIKYSNMEKYAIVFVKDELPKYNNTNMIQYLKELIKLNIDLYFVSGGMDIYLSHFAKIYNAKLLCTQLQVNNNRFTGSISGKKCTGVEKVRRLHREGFFNKYSYENIAVFSDSFSDMPLFNVGKYKIAVNPDRDLRKISQNNNSFQIW